MLLRTHTDLGAECISDLTLDAWRAGEIEPERAQSLTRHLNVCASCAERRRALLADAETYALRPDFAEPLQRVHRELERRARRRSLAKLSGATAAVALALAVALGTGLQPSSELRRKGGSLVGFYVLRGDQVFRGQHGQHLRPGDRLRFTWRGDRRVYLAVLSLDAERVASIYYPAASAEQQPLVPIGAEIELPAAVELDGTLGREDLFVISCAAPSDVTALQRLLAERGALDAPPGCELQRLQLYKERVP